MCGPTSMLFLISFSLQEMLLPFTSSDGTLVVFSILIFQSRNFVELQLQITSTTVTLKDVNCEYQSKITIKSARSMF